MKFYIIIDDKQMGPFGLDELKVRGLKPDTPVWAEGMQDWAVAGEVPALESAIIPGTQRLATPPSYQGTRPLPGGGGLQPPYGPDQTPGQPAMQSVPRNYRPLIVTAIVVVILALLVFTCPDNAAHQRAVKSEVKAFVNESIDENNPTDGLLGSILSLGSKYLSGVALDSFMENSFSTDNYIVCSIGRIDFMGKSKMVSFGIMGHVFTFSKEDLALSLERSIGVDASTQQSEKKAEKTDESVSKTEGEDGQDADDKMIGSIDSMANRFVDSVGRHIKKKATKAATDWIKKQVDKLNE